MRPRHPAAAAAAAIALLVATIAAPPALASSSPMTEYTLCIATDGFFHAPMTYVRVEGGSFIGLASVKGTATGSCHTAQLSLAGAVVARSSDPAAPVYQGSEVSCGTIPSGFTGRVDVVATYSAPALGSLDGNGVLQACTLRLAAS